MNSNEIRTHPVESRLSLEEPACHGQDTEPVVEEAEEAEIGTDQDPESDSDEEEIMESVAEGQRRRYPLRERRAPRRFPDAEHVLLTDEGEPESFEEAKDDNHSRKWLSPCKMRWIPCMRTMCTSWWSCREERGHSEISGCHDMARLEPRILCYMGRALDH